jgi:NAD(P)-dependent dehydrogenase (short-subunit alcohol dehydrogenase family)
MKMDKLTAVVIGCTRGIGLAIAESLVKRNASVAITYKGEDKDALNASRHLERLLRENRLF